MTLDEAIEKLEFMKRAYQELRDASIMNGIVSGNAGEIKGKWHSDGHVLEAYQKCIDVLEMSIRSLEAWQKVREDIKKQQIADFIAVQSVLDIINRNMNEVDE